MNEKIKDMAFELGKKNFLCAEDCEECIQIESKCSLIKHATILYEAGYRKEKDTARDVLIDLLNYIGSYQKFWIVDEEHITIIDVNGLFAKIKEIDKRYGLELE